MHRASCRPPALPAGFAWARPNFGNNIPTDDYVEIRAPDQRGGSVVPMATREGWLAQIGCHREEMEGRYPIWTRAFGRGVDYVLGWVRRYGPAIAPEAEAHDETLLDRHRH
ncbi:hypothetical protein [Lysobacter antibioticus]|uniref:hypothetical protein n=1 Tax=Lysobacter antibioticus TaxID=84531 RepID=UPI0007170443|nr:hypothetical protein [Lysobacter antibioticus]